MAQYARRYTILTEVWIHSHFETGKPYEWDLLGYQCDGWVNADFVSVLIDSDWRATQMEHFVSLPVDEAIEIEIGFDSDVDESGYVEWWIDSVKAKGESK